MGKLTRLPSQMARAPRVLGHVNRAEAERARNRARAAGASLRKLYSSKRWRDLRLEVLEDAGWLCQGCDQPHLLTGRAPAGNSPVVDHVEPHRGNLTLFWDRGNLQAVCKAYHDRDKQRIEAADRRQAAPRGWS